MGVFSTQECHNHHSVLASEYTMQETAYKAFPLRTRKQQIREQIGLILVGVLTVLFMRCRANSSGIDGSPNITRRYFPCQYNGLIMASVFFVSIGYSPCLGKSSRICSRQCSVRCLHHEVRFSNARISQINGLSSHRKAGPMIITLLIVYGTASQRHTSQQGLIAKSSQPLATCKSDSFNRCLFPTRNNTIHQGDNIKPSQTSHWQASVSIA